MSESNPEHVILENELERSRRRLSQALTQLKSTSSKQVEMTARRELAAHPYKVLAGLMLFGVWLGYHRAIV